MKEYVLVTGATGFVGRHFLAHLLNENVKIIVVSRGKVRADLDAEVEYIQHSLADIDVIIDRLRGKKISTCFHLAWEGIPNFSFENCEKNLSYGLGILKLCRELSIKKLIVTGSCLEYKETTGLVSEMDELESENLFAVCKNAIHSFAHVFCKEHDIKLYWLRLFYVVGTGQREGSILPYLIDQCSKGISPILKTPCDSKDFISVEDVAEALIIVWKENPPEETYNVGTGELIMVNDLRSMVEKYYNIVGENDVLNVEGTSRFGADCTRIMSDTTWRPKESIVQSIHEMIEKKCND